MIGRINISRLSNKRETEKKKVPIELCYWVNTTNAETEKANESVKNYKNAYLIEDSSPSMYDTIICESKECGNMTYLGHWNDGVIE